MNFLTKHLIKSEFPYYTFSEEWIFLNKHLSPDAEPFTLSTPILPLPTNLHLWHLAYFAKYLGVLWFQSLQWTIVLSISCTLSNHPLSPVIYTVRSSWRRQQASNARTLLGLRSTNIYMSRRCYLSHWLSIYVYHYGGHTNQWRLRRMVLSSL